MRSIEIITDGEHEEMANTYQCLTLASLNETLKKHGIVDKDLRERICSDFLFDHCYRFDAGWFEQEGLRLYPQLCFAERVQDPEQNLGDAQVLHIQSQDYGLHDSAFGNADWYFEDHLEDSSQIKTGSYQQADEPAA